MKWVLLGSVILFSINIFGAGLCVEESQSQKRTRDHSTIPIATNNSIERNIVTNKLLANEINFEYDSAPLSQSLFLTQTRGKRLPDSLKALMTNTWRWYSFTRNYHRVLDEVSLQEYRASILDNHPKLADSTLGNYRYLSYPYFRKVHLSTAEEILNRTRETQPLHLFVNSDLPYGQRIFNLIHDLTVSFDRENLNFALRKREFSQQPLLFKTAQLYRGYVGYLYFYSYLFSYYLHSNTPSRFCIGIYSLQLKEGLPMNFDEFVTHKVPIHLDQTNNFLIEETKKLSEVFEKRFFPQGKECLDSIVCAALKFRHQYPRINDNGRKSYIHPEIVRNAKGFVEEFFSLRAKGLANDPIFQAQINSDDDEPLLWPDRDLLELNQLKLELESKGYTSFSEFTEREGLNAPIDLVVWPSARELHLKIRNL